MSTKKYRLAPPSNGNKHQSISYKVIPINPIKSTPRWWLVLPCVILIIFVHSSDPLLINDLVVNHYEHLYGVRIGTSVQQAACHHSKIRMNPHLTMFYWQHLFEYRSNNARVQKAAAQFHIKNSVANLFPAIIAFVVLGSNVDLIGHRPLLVLPFLGKVIRYTCILIIITRNLSINWIIGVHAIEVCFGSAGLVTLSTLTYITECTKETRTRAFFITEVLSAISRIVPVLTFSLWLRRHSYTVPITINLTLSAIGFFYA